VAKSVERDLDGWTESEYNQPVSRHFWFSQKSPNKNDREMEKIIMEQESVKKCKIVSKTETVFENEFASVQD
jgi:hypothetical protein